MKTIQKNIENEIEIKHSKFITKLYKVENLEEIEEILTKVKKNYQDATHICYAYKIGENAKFSDAGEPGGTAGLPMMEVLIKQQLDYVLVVVIRYFGGIKLGSGGLVRAYSKSVAEAIKKVPVSTLVSGYQIQITCNYENSKQLDYQLKNISNIKKEYTEQITYKLQVDKEILETLKEWNPIILKNILIEKDSNQN